MGPKIFENEKDLNTPSHQQTKEVKDFMWRYSRNNFIGRIPNMIENLQGLQALNLSNNNLNGRIASLLANITYLDLLDVSMNILSGETPPGLLQLTFL